MIANKECFERGCACYDDRVDGKGIEVVAKQGQDEPVAVAWAEGYRMGIADERTSEANIGIAGFNAKVEPARENPYVTTPPQRTWVGLTNKQLLQACQMAEAGNYMVAFQRIQQWLREKNG